MRMAVEQRIARFSVCRRRVSVQLFLTVVSGLVLGLCHAVGGSICEPIRIDVCRSMPYNITQFPNFLHHSTQTNAGLVLDQFVPLIESNCSHLLVFYLCAVFVPVCPIHFHHENIPPCRSVCHAARTGCEPVLARFNHTWPKELSCEELPKHEAGVCITPDAIDHNTPLPASNVTTNEVLENVGRGSRKPSESGCDCKLSDRPTARKAYMKQRFHYIVRATFLKTERITGNHVFISVKVTQVLRKSKTAIPLQRRIGLWTENRCLCQKFVKGKEYLIMGFEDEQRKMLKFNRKSVVEPWKKNWPKYIKKWEKRVQKHKERETVASDLRSKPRKRQPRETD